MPVSKLYRVKLRFGGFVLKISYPSTERITELVNLGCSVAHRTEVQHSRREKGVQWM